MIITEQNILNLAVLFTSLSVTNFITIHLMANLTLYNGISRRKSARLSTEFALLSTTLVLCMIIGYNIIEPGLEITTFRVAAVLLGLEGIVSGYAKWWYIHVKLETTWLEAVIISEWLKITLLIILGLTMTLFPSVF